MKMETLQQRRDELERKEQQLKESLLKFDKFLKVWHLLRLNLLSTSVTIVLRSNARCQCLLVSLIFIIML